METTHLAVIAIACVLVLLGHAGFAFYETGLSRAKNASFTVAMNALVWPLAIVGFFVSGFAFMYGGATSQLGLDRWIVQWGGWNIVALKGLFFSAFNPNQPVIGIMFLMGACRVSILAAIPTGSTAERWRFKHFIVTTLLVCALLAPIFGSWVWGSGWIAQLGEHFTWPHGGIDYAGSSVIHLQGAVLGLMFTRMLGPRMGKYDNRKRPRPILGHHIPMAVLGSMIIGVAMLALNVLASIARADAMVPLVTSNSLIAGAAGGTCASIYMIWRFGKADPTMLCNGIISGLVAIAASCAFVHPWAAFVIGGIAGVLAISSISFWEKRGVDDPAGAISVHGTSGLWGIIALGLFANEATSQSFGFSTPPPVCGWFYGDFHQLQAQLLLALACVTWNVIGGAIVFKFASLIAGPARVPPEIESSGLDIAEVGVPAYRELLNPLSTSTRFVSEPRPAASPTSAGKNRFSVVIEGVDSATLINVWSSLCQAGAEPPSEDFKTVYPHVTTVTGNRFRFNGGDSAAIKQSLTRLFQQVLADQTIFAKVES